MLVLAHPKTKIYFAKEPGNITYPANVLIQVVLSPEEFFGAGPLSGKIRLAPVGATLKATLQSYRGAGRLGVDGSFPKLQFESGFLGRGYSLDGNIANFRFDVRNLQELQNFLDGVDLCFSAIFSGWEHAPLEIEDVRGSINGVQFGVSSGFSASPAFLCVDPNRLKSYLDICSPKEIDTKSIILVSCLRYLQQADRLDSEGRYAVSFLAERLLNIAKALEVIFLGGVDDMRKLLASIGVDSMYAEIFASVRYLRNEVDVGHVSFSRIDASEVEDVMNLADNAIRCVRFLIQMLMQDPNMLATVLGSRNSENKTRGNTPLRHIKRYRNMVLPKDGNLKVPPSEAGRKS